MCARELSKSLCVFCVSALGVVTLHAESLVQGFSGSGEWWVNRERHRGGEEIDEKEEGKKEESALRICASSYVFSPPGPTSILPTSLHAPGVGAAQPVTDFAPDLEEHQPRTSIACTLPSRSAVAACTQRAHRFRAAAESGP